MFFGHNVFNKSKLQKIKSITGFREELLIDPLVFFSGFYFAHYNFNQSHVLCVSRSVKEVLLCLVCDFVRDLNVHKYFMEQLDC